jgi:tRNA-(ms[2]io[6]A)-hydroxylase
MAELAKEEMDHFQMVLGHLKQRNWKLGREQKDNYVRDLQGFFEGANRKRHLVNRLLLAAMIEARSCERFRVVSENIKDSELASFYKKLMKSEANHYSMFLQFAKKFGEPEIDVDKIWKEFLSFEAEVISRYGSKEMMHG